MVDQQFNNSTKHFPLWVITFWQQIGDITNKQVVWGRSIKWLDLEAKKANDELTKVEICMPQTELSMMGWNAPLTYCHGQVTTLTLSMLLSTVWLSDDHIDMMMEELAAQIAADPKLAAECVVAPLGFSSVIKAANFKKRYTKRDTPLLCCYADHVKENNLWWLYFPIHINDNHWVVGFINFKDVTFGYGKYWSAL